MSRNVILRGEGEQNTMNCKNPNEFDGKITVMVEMVGAFVEIRGGEGGCNEEKEEGKRKKIPHFPLTQIQCWYIWIHDAYYFNSSNRIPFSFRIVGRSVGSGRG